MEKKRFTHVSYLKVATLIVTAFALAFPTLILARTPAAAAGGQLPILTADMTPAQVVAALPRNQTLYFNGQQWGTVNCWNPYSSNCNNAMAISQQDNARVTMFETPYMFDMLDGNQYPLLATGPWAWNDDKTAISFDINPAAKWRDGTSVTAADVAYTWTTNATYGTSLGNTFSPYIDSVEATGTYSVQVNAKLDGDGKAINPLMVVNFLSNAYVVQKAWTQTLEVRNGYDGSSIQNDAALDSISSGPYYEYFANTHAVVLVRNDQYWGQDASSWGKLPAPKYLAHVIFADNDTSEASFEAGDGDVSQQIIANEQDLWQVDHLPISTYLPDAPYQVGSSLPTAFYNLSSNGLDQVVIRKAIAIAVNYDAIIHTGMTDQSATFEQVPRSLMVPTAAEQALYDHSAVASLQWTGNDIAGANAILDEAGIIDTDNDGYREYNGQKLTYVVSCPNGWTDWMAAVELIAEAGQAIGIDITTNYPDTGTFENAVTNWPLPTGYDIFIMWTDGAGPEEPWGRINHLMNSVYAQTSGNWNGNWGGYSNPTADALINAIPAETDATTLKNDYTQLTQIYLTDIPSFTVMYRPQNFHTVNESVWTHFPHQGDGTNPPVPPLDLTDGYSIAGLYNLVLKHYLFMPVIIR